MISVVDARLITYSGPVLVPVRKSATLKANTENAGKAELKATMTCKLIYLYWQHKQYIFNFLNELK